MINNVTNLPQNSVEKMGKPYSQNKNEKANVINRLAKK
jgi:hypothetical protein